MMPPYDEPDWFDIAAILLGALLLAVILSAVVWFANETGVART